MLDQKITDTVQDNSTTIGPAYLCLHGHFYQPPREDPFKGKIPVEPTATPYVNFNEKIPVDCYRPNAEAGNFAFINFALVPPSAPSMYQPHPHIYHRTISPHRHHPTLTP